MITRNLLKAEIDTVQEQYLEVLLKIIKAFEEPEQENKAEDVNSDKQQWSEFLNRFAGILADSPIQQGEQGTYKEITVWYDKEGDYLEVIFEKKAGYFKEADNDAIMQKVDTYGNIIGFSILNVSSLKEQKPVLINLACQVA